MRAMVLENIGGPLVLQNVPIPTPKPFEVLIKIKTCGVCRTDLHIIDGELPTPKLPLILGHQIVGTIVQLGAHASKYQLGEQVGVPWLGGSCHSCEFCLSERENLCDQALYTGYLCNGGYAEYCTAHEDYLLRLPDDYDALEAAPLLCAGLIGYRAFRLANPKKTVGFYGFGSSAHLLIQIANGMKKEVYVFTRPGDQETQNFALSLGAAWSGGSDQMPPILLDAALIFAPVGSLYPQALQVVKKGGKVISAGIHMSDIPSFPYALLWEERSISSVANLTRQDGIDYMKLVQQYHPRPRIACFSLENANEALTAIKNGTIEGSAVISLSKKTYPI